MSSAILRYIILYRFTTDCLQMSNRLFLLIPMPCLAENFASACFRTELVAFKGIINFFNLPLFNALKTEVSEQFDMMACEMQYLKINVSHNLISHIAFFYRKCFDL